MQWHHFCVSQMGRGFLGVHASMICVSGGNEGAPLHFECLYEFDFDQQSRATLPFRAARFRCSTSLKIFLDDASHAKLIWVDDRNHTQPFCDCISQPPSPPPPLLPLLLLLPPPLLSFWGCRYRGMFQTLWTLNKRDRRP